VNHDGRFAPSPSGPLHAGNLRTALVAWMRARSKGARFLLRIEDLDPQRSKREHERAQIEDLRAIGVDWDEPPVRQSERHALYAEALAELERQERVYPCWCTRAEIRQASQAPHGPLPEGAYPGTCRRLTAAQRAERERETGRAPALRLDSRSEAVDDFVLRRHDGAWAYNLAVIVDDADQGIGEVVRGEDLVDTTPRQLLLADLLSLAKPAYIHVPLVTDEAGRRLAKRDDPGIDPEVLARIRAEAEELVRRLGARD
jgi:glutamyl-tRNA synthetase